MKENIQAKSNDVSSLIEQQHFDEAIKSLHVIIQTESSSEHYSRLGLVYFLKEQYAEAIINYEKALQLEPNNLEWQEMLQHCRGNFISEVNVAVPDFYYFDKEKLLAKPVIAQGKLPSGIVPAPPPGISKRLKLIIGDASGALLTLLMNIVTKIYGGFAGYRDKIWTNWYRRPLLFGILTLAYMREKINAHNLKSTYPKDVLVGFQPEGQLPPDGVKYFRTADGSWNNLSNPKEGAAGTRFGRNVDLSSTTPETGEKLLTPNPREISRHLLTRKEEMKEVPFLNMLAACWIQFMNHDWINHGENVLNEIIEVPFAKDDPARKKFWQTKMLVPRTQADPTRVDGKEDSPVSFINEVTHWWDASQVYGSDQETVDRLRSGIDGKLKTNPDGTLVVGKKGVEETGFVRNWWIGLSMLHTLFTREHNAICDHLKKHYPSWDDNRLFNVARISSSVTF